jgi:hypothetical protein
MRANVRGEEPGTDVVIFLTAMNTTLLVKAKTRLRRRKSSRLFSVALSTCDSPRLRQSLAALGFGYGLNEKPDLRAKRISGRDRMILPKKPACVMQA